MPKQVKKSPKAKEESKSDSSKKAHVETKEEFKKRLIESGDWM